MKTKEMEKRQFYRHPVEAPIQYHEDRTKRFDRSSSIDLSLGGICFIAHRFIARGADITLKIPVGGTVFSVRGRVVYSNRVRNAEFYRTGVAFQDPTRAFRTKLAEQMQRIEIYRQERSEEEGHLIPEEEAARQWIERYAKHFSNLF